MNKKIYVGIAVVFLFLASLIYGIEPSAPDSFENISSDSPEPTMGTEINISGGTISTINFNVTSQNPRWKGFVGNVTGKFALMDSNSMSIYDWTLIDVQGEIYATRDNNLVDWNNVGCADYIDIKNEQSTLGFSDSDEDSINNTFNRTKHVDFYAGNTYIAADSCPSTYLFVNGSSQESYFQELLLYDNEILYTGILEDDLVGFNNKTYDYQMILPDNVEQGAVSESYYFYIELI